MGVAELKEELHNYTDHADERLKKLVYAIFFGPTHFFAIQ